MKKLKITLAAFSLIFSAQQLMAQEKPSEFKVGIYGFARADYIFDTRQSLISREEQVNLYPLDKNLDLDGKDINASSASNFLSIVSRVGVKASGPKVWGAKTAAVIEGDFFGNTNSNTALFTLRQAYASLEWEKTTLLLGQTWYPTFVTDVSPGVANFNTGLMFNPFGRAPQIKLTQKLTDNISLDLVAYKMSTHSAPSVTTNANEASYNSITPTFHGKIQYKDENITTGIGAEYQSLKPLIASAGRVSDHTVNSNLVMAYFKYSNDKFVAKAYGITGSNLYHLTMLGGFAGYTEPNGQESYKSAKVNAFWADIASNNAKIAPGLFFGYTKNNGVDAGYSKLYTRGLGTARSLENVWRISGRVDFKQNKFRISPELEYTSATWGDSDTNAIANNNKATVANFRTLISAVYSF
jgi:hypothetical protein